MAKQKFEPVRIEGKTYYIRAEDQYRFTADQRARELRNSGAFESVRVVKRGKNYAVAVLLKPGFRPYRGESGATHDYSTYGTAIRKRGSGAALRGECLKCGYGGIKPRHIQKRKHGYTQWKCSACGYTAEKQDVYL